MMQPLRFRNFPVLGLLCAAVAMLDGFAPHALADIDPGMDFPDGRSIYRFYCYQCHGYAGDARTLASTYLSPKPRDFTTLSPDSLPLDRMLDSVRSGRPGTAMVNFDAVLRPDQIRAVVDYVRSDLLGNTNGVERYHSVENGWINHDKYRDAFPFVRGEIELTVPWDELDPEEQRGRKLYESACVSCHDQPNSATGEAVWDTRAVSFPRRHYSHREAPLDVVSGASPYARHDVPTVPDDMTPIVAKGLDLYQENCAFCHAADGTAHNWIGSFLEPRPRDFTSDAFTLTDSPAAFRATIKAGLPGTSMPAWRHVLTDDEIDAIIAYISAAFRPQD